MSEGSTFRVHQQLVQLRYVHLWTGQPRDSIPSSFDDRGCARTNRLRGFEPERPPLLGLWVARVGACLAELPRKQNSEASSPKPQTPNPREGGEAGHPWLRTGWPDQVVQRRITGCHSEIQVALGAQGLGFWAEGFRTQKGEGAGLLLKHGFHLGVSERKKTPPPPHCERRDMKDTRSLSMGFWSLGFMPEPQALNPKPYKV